MFPERASAFSPEDLYSNALGARLAGGVVALRQATTDRTYERTMDRWTREALEELGALDAGLGMAAADEVDGIWWDSGRRVPDPGLVLRRSFDVGTVVEPWTVGRSGARARSWEAAHCPEGAEPLPLRISERLGEVRFAEVARLEIRPAGTVREHLRPGGRRAHAGGVPAHRRDDPRRGAAGVRAARGSLGRVPRRDSARRVARRIVPP